MASTPPPGLTLATALDRSEPLTHLMERLRESKARLTVVAPLLPVGLREGVRAGPLDETAWVILVSHAAAAAKLRQLLPALTDALRAQGWHGPAVKIKVAPVTSPGS